MILLEYNITKNNMEVNPPQIDLITDVETLSNDMKLNNNRSCLIYILVRHIKEKNGDNNNFRFPLNYSFKDKLTFTLTPEEHIREILQKVYSNELDNKVVESMRDKISQGQLLYDEKDNEYFKLSVYKRFIYNNKRLILEGALGLQASYLTAGSNQSKAYLAVRALPKYIRSNIYDNKIIRDLVNTYQNLKNQDNLFYKYNHFHIIDIDNLIERYSRPISLISGYSTWVKAVDENWEFDETNPLNIEENID